MASQPSLFSKFQASRDPVSKEMRDTAKRTTHTHITLTHRQRERVCLCLTETHRKRRCMLECDMCGCSGISGNCYTMMWTCYTGELHTLKKWITLYVNSFQFENITRHKETYRSRYNSSNVIIYSHQQINHLNKFNTETSRLNCSTDQMCSSNL